MLLASRLQEVWLSSTPPLCRSFLQLFNSNMFSFKLLTLSISLVCWDHFCAFNTTSQVLAPVLAWKPPPKPQPAAGQGPFGGLTKALTLNKATTAAAAADAEQGTAAAAGAASEAEGEAQGLPASTAAAAAAAAGGAGLAEAHKVLPLDDAELDAVVTVLEYMISHYSSVFAA
jgi:hypothetical protein